MPPPQPAGFLDPAEAADLVMSLCMRGPCFGPEKAFWEGFARIYAQVRDQVDPERHFAFATRVDGRLVEMGLAPWSIMSRLAAGESAGASVRTP